MLLRLLISTRDSIALLFVLSSFEEPPCVSGMAATALRLKTRFLVRVIFIRDLQSGSGQLSGSFALGTTNEAGVRHR